ncbi:MULTISPECIES: relaxase/mobilization nuclease domain-containing protein [Nostoc]|uniref:Relaxase/mobilization nuclease domain-containing protein n=1 Tax=Nostoc paludosum FACHB-159 TaxID=2692908 RepID=A0ABR8KH64_9NOSO|nr:MULTISPECIES: relaxase/mobilization nuclease domain-containing protein [Nostoc]MBD2682555.1 relaxase/mobilization nuclease domain-containing protein [Nostoc sp. FACHB-857]MBD2738887.1 relaxase/mobilization nuclease domain-containing protein [Nostoc paludosum FACHB-159]
MIGKQTKGRGFRKLLDYLESRENAQLIGGNMSGRNARELAREFRLSRQLNSDADRVVYHVSLSAAKGDKLDDEKWTEIGDRYMKEMGFDANQFVIFRHHNTDDDHVHIAASRIRMDTGLVVHDSWDYVRSEKVLRQIEIDYNLVQVQGSREKLNRTPSTGQIRRIIREQEEYSSGRRDTPPERTIKEQLQQTIDTASVDHPQMPILIWRLQLAGISVRTGFTRNGKSKGISYQKDGQAFSGTQLGAAYTFPGLQKHLGIDYQPERDDEFINKLLLKPVKPLPIEQLEKQFLELEQKHQQPQFTPPPEDKVVWQKLHKYLNEERYIPDYIVQGLHDNQLLYVDEQRNILFIKRDLDGSKTGALVWSKPRQNHRAVEYGQDTSTANGWFYLRLGGQPTDKVENVFLCSTPIDAMSAATYLISSCKGLPPTRTMLIVADDPNNLPMEFLKGFNRVVVAFNNDEQGNKAASAILELLPQGKRLKTHNPDWSQELEAHLREEQQKLIQQQRGFSL